MALVVNTNSYIDSTDADTYFADRLNSSVWTSATTKDEALIQATKIIDFKRYLGSRTDSAQSLMFPRSGLSIDGISVDSATVHQNILDATCELALYLLQEDYSEPDSLANYQEVSIGSISVTTKSGNKKLPPFVTELLRFAVAPTSTLHRG